MRRLSLSLALLIALALALAVVAVVAEDSSSDAAPDRLPDFPPAPTSSSSSSNDAPAAPAAASTPPPKNSEPISLNRADFCRACQSVVEEFQKWTVANFINPDARKNTTMSRGELVEWFCRTGAFARFKEPIMWGCIKTIQDHHDEVLSPFLGTHTSHEYTTLARVYQHKMEACAKIDACDPPTPQSQTRSKSDCESCDRLVRDMHWSLYREKVVNETVVHGMLSQVCVELGMRHKRPMEVEAFCHEYVDEHWKDLTKMLVKVWNDSNIPTWDRVNQMKKRFCGGMTEACESDRRELEAEKKAAKEKERAERLAARELKKQQEEAAASAEEHTNPAPKDDL